MVKVINADCREVLATLEPESIHCVITSPPYWSLRDYKLPPAIWGENGDCQHEWGQWQEKHSERETTKHGKTRTTDRHYGAPSRRFDGNHQKHTAGQFCHHCHAWRGSLGLEPTPGLYIQHLVEVFHLVRRVLRNDGTVWLNLGDSYAGNPGNGRGGETVDGGLPHRSASKKIGPRLKPKDLVGIPWRVALALQADGWWLRSDIIWHKPNCMPESVRDRPTKAHEYVFLLSKSKRYYYDQDAVREPAIYEGDTRHLRNDSSKKPGGPREDSGSRRRTGTPTHGRNKRTVWTIPTYPFKEAHFATFPPALIEPMIKAGCPEGGTVLDPFAGAGTTGLVADQLGRNAILIELNPDYVAMTHRRLEHR